MIFITLGPDSSMCRTETKRIVDEFDPSGSNTSRLDGKTLRMSEAITMLGTPAFFGGGRVIVIDELLARSSRGNDGSELDSETDTPRSGKTGVDLSSLFASVHPENVLLLSDPTLSSVPSAVAKQLPKEAQVILGDPPRGHALITWMQDQSVGNGTSLDRDAAQFLAEMLFPQTWSAKPSNPRYDRPPDLDQIASEISKLAQYAHPESISRQHVQALTDSALSDRLFSFVEQAVAGNLKNAVKDLESFDIHGDDAHRAANQLYQQIELSTVLASAQSADPAAVGRDLGLSNPQRMFGIARSPRPISLVESVLEAANTDRRVKTGRLKGVDDAIYDLMTDLAVARSQARERRGRS